VLLFPPYPLIALFSVFIVPGFLKLLAELTDLFLRHAKLASMLGNFFRNLTEKPTLLNLRSHFAYVFNYRGV